MMYEIIFLEGADEKFKRFSKDEPLVPDRGDIVQFEPQLSKFRVISREITYGFGEATIHIYLERV
jgi:hypothetical protein